MKVLIAASELEPFISTGKMAGRIKNISKAVSESLNVEYVIPLYSAIDENLFNIKPTGKGFEVPVADKVENAEIWAGDHPETGCRIWFVSNRYFERDGLYGNDTGDYPDNAERFVFFSRAVLEVARNISEPDIIHCNDWQTALVPLYLEEVCKKKGQLTNVRSILSIHDIRYQGRFWLYDLYILNLGWEVFSPEKLEFYNDINFLKGGIVYCDTIVTLNEKYTADIMKPESGCGMEGVIKKYREKLFSIGMKDSPVLDDGPFDGEFKGRIIKLYMQAFE